jgi:hypothetical protein
MCLRNLAAVRYAENRKKRLVCQEDISSVALKLWEMQRHAQPMNRGVRPLSPPSIWGKRKHQHGSHVRVKRVDTQLPHFFPCGSAGSRIPAHGPEEFPSEILVVYDHPSERPL